jgi:hypothetical protein
MFAVVAQKVLDECAAKYSVRPTSTEWPNRLLNNLPKCAVRRVLDIDQRIVAVPPIVEVNGYPNFGIRARLALSLVSIGALLYSVNNSSALDQAYMGWLFLAERFPEYANDPEARLFGYYELRALRASSHKRKLTESCFLIPELVNTLCDHSTDEPGMGVLYGYNVNAEC